MSTYYVLRNSMSAAWPASSLRAAQEEAEALAKKGITATIVTAVARYVPLEHPVRTEIVAAPGVIEALHRAEGVE